MKKSEVINSIYLVPALIEYMNGNKSDHIEQIIESYGINDIGQYQNLKPLLEYHLHIVQSGFKPDYNLLRAGLTEYYLEFLYKFWEIIGIVDTDYKLLDYGGGDGVYSNSFTSYNPHGEKTLLDRNRGLNIDFEKNPDWYKEYKDKFGLVLLSEILHCKGHDWQKYLISSSDYMLYEGGKIIINENLDPAMGWRLNEMTKEGAMMTESDIIQLMNGYNYKLLDIKTIVNHKVYIYEKL